MTISNAQRPTASGAGPVAWAGMPSASGDELGSGARTGVVLAMLGAHLLAGWVLLQIPAVRQAVGEAAPMMVDLIAPTPEAPKPAPPPPPQVQPVHKPPPPSPLVTAPPKVAVPTPPVFTAPPPPPEIPAPREPTAPAPTPAPVPAAPRAVVLTDSDWIRVPDLDYPQASRRMQEEGTVVVKAVIDTRGVPKRVSLHRSSGYARLDQAALSAAMSARVKPRTENGVPFEFSILMPLEFKLEN